MNSVLAGLIYRCCAVYLDDIVVASPTFKQHLDDLREVLSRLKSAGLTIKLAKCQFCRKDLTFLGYRVCPSGILPDQDKMKAVMDFKTPVNVKQVRQFLGLSGYYRRFIQDYARHAEPLFALTKNDAPFVWDSACQDAMDLLKQKLTSAPVLSFPDFTEPFFIHADACDVGLGAALMQRICMAERLLWRTLVGPCINRRNLIPRLRRNVWLSFGPLSTLGPTLRVSMSQSSLTTVGSSG